MAEFTPEKINTIVKQYIKETLSNDEKCRSLAGPNARGCRNSQLMSA